MNYLVTGGAGFIGSNLVDRLLALGHTVYVWDLLTTGKRTNLSDKVSFYYGDISSARDVSEISQAISKKGKIDGIFHVGGEARIQPSFQNPLRTHQSNIDGTFNMLLLAKEWNCKFVYAGSSTAYSDIYCNPYAFTKYIGGEYCKMFSKIWGISTAVARFFNVYGPRHLAEGQYATVVAIFEKQKKETDVLTPTGDGEQRRDFTHVYDIADGLIAMSKDKWEGDIFNLGTGRNYSINELAKMFKPKELQYLPKRPGEAKETLADLKFTKEKLGWQAKFTLEGYVAGFLNSLSEQKSAEMCK